MMEGSVLIGVLMAWSVIAIGASSPGPAVMAIIGTALERGRGPATILALGVISGSAIWGTLAAAGLATVLARYGQALIVLKVIGGLYLLWFAWRSLRTARSDAPPPRATGITARGTGRTWWTGLAIHLTNPKGVFGWMATIAVGMTPDTPGWVVIIIVVGGVTISAFFHVGYALLFSTERAAQLYERARRPIQYAFAAVFGVAGLHLLKAPLERTTP